MDQRAGVITGEWCPPTAELPGAALAGLLHASRCATGEHAPQRIDRDRAPTVPEAGRSVPDPLPEAEPTIPTVVPPPRERKERGAIPKLVVAPAYPIHRSSRYLLVRFALVGALAFATGITLRALS